jgi:glycine cleavage system H protein
MKKFAKTHEWINVQNGEVGITENAIELLGDIVFLELPESGKEISKDSPIAVVESVKAASDIYAPVSGKILEKNEDLENSPEGLNEQPNSWLFKIEPSNTEELDQLLNEDQYKEELEK